MDKKPSWIRGKIKFNRKFREIAGELKALAVKTVCEDASCPNKGECWARGHVTFMILGGICTRKCYFCNIAKGAPAKPDPEEPSRITAAVKKLGIKYAVVTSVTRDDLPDMGAEHFARVASRVKKINPRAKIELLIPDMGARPSLLKKVIDSGAECLAHNIEMPKELYAEVRPGADYERSLGVLAFLRRNSPPKVMIKSSLIIGLGETKRELLGAMKDLSRVGVDVLHIGQYLAPSEKHWPVKKYYAPREFLSLKREAEKLGIKRVLSAPLVRSSSLGMI